MKRANEAAQRKPQPKMLEKAHTAKNLGEAEGS